MDEVVESFPRYVYAPWVESEPHSERQDQLVAIARGLAAKTRLPVVGVASTMGSLPDDWGKLDYRTLKSRSSATGQSVIEVHFWPTFDSFAALRPAGRYNLVLEWGNDDLSGWARHNHAFSFRTKTELAPSLSPEAKKLYERIEWNGNNGWSDAPGKRDALRDLRELQRLGELDVADLSGYMIGRKGNRAIRQLVSLTGRV